MMEVAVTTGTKRRAKLESGCQQQQTDTDRMPFLFTTSYSFIRHYKRLLTDHLLTSVILIAQNLYSCR